MLNKAVNTAYDLDEDKIIELAKSNYSISGANKIYISNDERKIRKAKQIDNSGIFYETNLSANNIVSFIRDLLMKMQLDAEDFSFSLSETPFDINNQEI